MDESIEGEAKGVEGPDFGDTPLEQRVAKLERTVAEHSALLSSRQVYVDDLHSSVAGEDGAVSFTGFWNRNDDSLSYSWVRDPDALIEVSWDDSFRRLSALAHPQRAAFLKQLIKAPATVSDLSELGLTSSTGAAYHHLNDLEAAGWIRKLPKGHYEVPPERIIPLLVIVAASEGH
ncbi:winged helix-turn-helix domain-containing protein [Corynebacterium sp. S7]